MIPSILNSEIPLHEIYKYLSSEGIHREEVKTGVLLYLCSPGDTIVAEWLMDKVQLSDIVWQAVNCALQLIDVCKNQRKEHGKMEPIRITISAGRFSKMRLGDEDSQVCFITGSVVDEIRSAEALAKHGDVLLSPEAHRLCNKENLTFKLLENEQAFKINEAWQMRDLPQLWLATILCVNLQYGSSEMDQCYTRQETRQIITKQVAGCRGVICNDFYFKEGCVYLCIIGLPGDRSSDKTIRALQAAYRIHEMCLQVRGILSISVGVTTGRVMYDTELATFGNYAALVHIQTMRIDERLVVKYASAIGHTFTYEMLQNIMSFISERDLAVPLEVLVREGIFKCAFKPDNSSSDKTCYCKANYKGYTIVSMDPVWDCRLMSFCDAEEFQMVRELTQTDPKTFQVIHKRCAKYLESKRYRCGKCRARTFIFEQRAATEDNVENLRQIYNTLRPFEAFWSEGLRMRTQKEQNGNNTENFQTIVMLAQTKVRNGRTADSCQCAQLVETVLIPRLTHWKLAGDIGRAFYYLLECAAAFVYLQNNARALEFLNEARFILENLEQVMPAFPSAKPVQIDESQQVFLYRLTGEILFKEGKYSEAEENFMKVLKILKCKFPHKLLPRSLKLVQEKIKKVSYQSRMFKIPEKEKLTHMQECIVCLSYLFQIDCISGQFQNASLAVIMEINLAIQSGDPFKILHSAIDYLQYNQITGETNRTRHLEDFLCRTCTSLSGHPDGQKLLSYLSQKTCSRKKKKKCGPGGDAEAVLEDAEHGLEDAEAGLKDAEHWLEDGEPEPRTEPTPRTDPDTASAPTALFSAPVGEGRRKRPRYCEDHANGVNAADVRASGKFVCTRGTASGESACGSRQEVHANVTHPDDIEDDLCAFNSFQFWRTPLPQLDLSLLDSPYTAELTEDSSSKEATEDMET
ncbi:hypothetical protein C0J45_18547 [Silurus meridionalis]|nr:hypothetical protein C0J45_18547 [Silurus meridionalis]